MSKDSKRVNEIVHTALKLEKPRRSKRRRRRPPLGAVTKQQAITKMKNKSMKNFGSQYKNPPTNMGFGGSNTQRIKMQNLLADTDLMGFMQATTHPFGPQGVGAIIPDAYDESCISTYDPHSVNIDLTGLFNRTSITAFDGFIVTLMPRCVASGMFSGVKEDADGTSPNSWTGNTLWNLSFVFVDSDFKPLFTAGSLTPDTNPANFVWTDPYYLCLMPIDTSGHSIVQIIETSGASTTPKALRGVYVMRMPRVANINTNTEGFRIVGAGVKLNPRTAPINTSGVCFGGQIRIASLIKLWKSDLVAANTGTFKNFQENLVGHYVNVKGIRGATSRLNIFQNQDQLVKQATSIASAWSQYTSASFDLSLYRKKSKIGRPKSQLKDIEDIDDVTIKRWRSSNRPIIKPKYDDIKETKEKEDADGEDLGFSFAIKDKYNRTILKETIDRHKLGAVLDKYVIAEVREFLGVSPSKNDLIDPGDMVPCCYYQFNSSAPLLLQLRAVVHGVAEPIPTLPFLGRPVRCDPLFNQMKAIVPNPAIFPLVATGNSFKTVLGKFNNIFGHVIKGASRIHKFSKLVEDKF